MKPSINENLSLIGVELDLGGGIPGAALGPKAVRYAHVVERLSKIGYDVRDEGDIEIGKDIKTKNHDEKLKYLDEIIDVNTKLCKKVSDVMEEGRFPLILGGDHSIAIGTIAGVLQHKKNPGVIWFDAHADINTEDTTPSGKIHGMPVAVALGYGNERLRSIGGKDAKLDPKNLVYIGCRDLDPGERIILKELGIAVFTMHEVDLYGMPDIIQRAIKIAGTDTDGIHVSFDMDCMDPFYAPGTGTKVLGGLTYRECNLALEMVASTDKLISAEFVEVNPLVDTNNETAKTAVTLMGSLLGEWLI